MSQLPFGDLPETLSGWPEFWQTWPLKVSKKDAKKAYGIALKTVEPDRMLSAAKRFIANKPDWMQWPYAATWIRAERWEDEYDAPAPKPSSYTHDQLQIIAAHVNRDWYKGEYDRDVLQQCVDAGLLTMERMEEIS